MRLTFLFVQEYLGYSEAGSNSVVKAGIGLSCPMATLLIILLQPHSPFRYN